MQETQYLKLFFPLPITFLYFPDSGAKFSVSKTNRFSRVVNELVILYKLVISYINVTLLHFIRIYLRIYYKRKTEEKANFTKNINDDYTSRSTR